ncbi:TRAP transporter small permease [Yanghanlia caeni]|uniref:TRAP transporter small permease protein n=1 Tax=Yanghanlia caeni TaxID=3064283 RepID=A0ABU1D6M0_9BURK|nr:TRAP transporter small permease [Alcaligenaceae bacterium LG-2]
MKLVNLLDRSLFRAVSIVCKLLLFSAVAAGFYQVVSRFILQSPADWSEVWTRSSLIWTVMLGLCLAFRHGAMLSVEMLHGMLKGRARRWLEHGIMLVCVGFLGFMAWVGAQMAWRVRFQMLASLEFSISWIYIAIPIGTTLAILGVLVRWLEAAEPPAVDDTVI